MHCNQQNKSAISKLNHWLEQTLLFDGVTHFAFTYYSQKINSHYAPKYCFTSKAYRGWNRYYQEEKLIDVDSCMQEVYQSNVPMHWNCQRQLENATCEKEKQIRHDSLEYGALDGLSIPTHGPNSEFGILTIIRMKNQNFNEKLSVLESKWIGVAHQYFQQLRSHYQPNKLQFSEINLTENQITCLKLTAQQLHIESIAKKMNITKRTVNYHLHKANKILGAQNKHEAITKAIQLGFIDPELIR